MLIAIGIILFHFAPLYLSESISSISEHRLEGAIDYLEQSGMSISDEQKLALNSFTPDSGIDMEMRLRELRVFIVALLVVLFLVFSIIGFQTFGKYAEPIDNVTATAIELAKGNYKVRVPSVQDGAVDQLSTSVNILARNLQDISFVRKIEEERLKTLIENMGSALVMIGREGKITVVNKPFLNQFDFDFNKVNNQPFRNTGLPSEVVEFIDMIFMTEKSARKQIRFEYQQVKHMELYGAPVIGEHGRWLGVVIVMHDVTELVRLEQIRKDFVANVSHELKTPITSIKGFSETLLDGAMEDRQALVDFLQIIHKESERLQFLIQDLLELSKIEQHGFSIELHRTSLREIIERSMEMVAQKAEEKGMSLVLEMEEEIELEADPGRMIQIVMNLLANAINYSPSGTAVTVRAYMENKHGVIKISDEGIGIEQQELARIFERFYRVDRARSRNSGGTGLGLAIVKHLVEAHNGRIAVNSKVGKGTTFKVSIPLKQSK